MINNYNLVREAELEYRSRQSASVERQLELMSEMTAFANEFRAGQTPPADSQHVRNLSRQTEQIKKNQRAENKEI